MQQLYVVIRKESLFERIQVVDTEDAVVGRDNNCGIWLPDPFVSRRHSILLKRKNGCWIRDLGSRNGTFLNGRPIQTEEEMIHDGNEVRIGPYLLNICFDIAKAVGATAMIDGSTRTNCNPNGVDGDIESKASRLTPGQRRVHELLLQGLIEKEVAQPLGITIHTVHHHVKAIYRVLSVSTRGELISQWAIQEIRRTREGS